MKRRKNQTLHFREKCAFASNALFSRKYRFIFRSETEKRTSGASVTASGGRTPGRRSGVAKPRQAKPLPKSSGASERRREASGARRPSLTERAERASICRPSQAASNSGGGECSLFVVSSPLFGGGSTLSARTRKRDGTDRSPHSFLSVICSRIREIDCRNISRLAFLLP